MTDVTVEARARFVDFAVNYGPRCRDCAHENDVCPISGIPCGGRRKATEFVVDALIYGAQHGYVPATLTPEPGGVVRKEKPGRFAEWSTFDLSAQCSMQAREQLDPEFSQFMQAVADRLLAPEQAS